MFRSRFPQTTGFDYGQMMSYARREYHKIQKRTPRRSPYVRSKYFNKDKVFINTFWDHLKQKSTGDRRRRLVLFACGIDLIRHNTEPPTAVKHRASGNETLYRFDGLSLDGAPYAVQVKENIRSSRKDLISIFPKQNKKASRY